MNIFHRKKKSKTAKKTKGKVVYQVSIGGTKITFACRDAKHYRHIELTLVGIAKLLNQVQTTTTGKSSPH